jgi:hypothetical protein
MAIWETEGWKTLRHTPPPAARKWLNFDEIAKLLLARRTPGLVGLSAEGISAIERVEERVRGYTANGVSIVVGQIERYQAAHAQLWKQIIDVQIDPRPSGGRRPKVVRFTPFSIITYPCTASLALYLYNHSVPQSAFHEARKLYPKTFDWDLDKFQQANYIRPSTTRDVDWEVTDRIDCEALYLEEVARYYDPNDDPFPAAKSSSPSRD